MNVFTSRRHPGTAPPALVFARAHVRPIAVCLLPVMILASIGVLVRVDPLYFLAWSVPTAYVVATVWTLLDLTRTPAEVSIRPGEAAVRTIWEIARARPPTWGRMTGVKNTGHSLLLNIDQTVYELHPRRWPELDLIYDTLLQNRSFIPRPEAPIT